MAGFKGNEKFPSRGLTEIQAFGEVIALYPDDESKLRNAIEVLKKSIGEEAYADALGVAAFFAFISRVVDATGHTSKLIEFGTWVRQTGHPKAFLVAILTVSAAIFCFFGFKAYSLFS